MDELSQLRSQVITATLKPSKRIEESDKRVSAEGRDPNMNGSELAIAVKKSGSLLEQVLDAKAKQAGEVSVIDENRKIAIKQTDFGMMEGIMRAMR